MRIWKVILAAAVIFAAGLMVGAVGLKQLLHSSSSSSSSAASPPPVPFPPPLRAEYVQYMSRELELTPEQRQVISQIVGKSQERVKILFDLISPDLREELRLTREEIRTQLTPEQRNKFDKLPARRPRWGSRPGSRDSHRGRRGGQPPPPQTTPDKPPPL